MSRGCLCCSAAGPGLGKLFLTGRQSRRQHNSSVPDSAVTDVPEEDRSVLEGKWVWTEGGEKHLKDNNIKGFGSVKAGDPLTLEQLADLRANVWKELNCMNMASFGMIGPSGGAKEEFLTRWALQERFFRPPASLAPAPVPPPAPGGGVLVNTVLGPVSTRTLGMTLPHEHCYVSSAGVLQVYPEMVPVEDFVVPQAVAAFRELKDAGGGTVVDCTTFDLGRDVAVMQRISSDSGIHIIPTTGLWMDGVRSLFSTDPDQLASFFIRECTVGIQGTGIKAGIIKCAHESGPMWDRGRGFTSMGETTCRAAARAHKATGLPITTHTEVEEHIGMAQIHVFEEEGVDLNRVYIGHCNDSTDLDYLTCMLKKGVWLGLDRTGPGMAEPGVTRPEWEERARTVWRLIEAGWGHRIMLSHDWMVYMGFAGPEEGGQKHRDKNPLGYTFILKKLIPRVQELGATKEQTDAILYENPVRFFEGAS